MNLPECLKPTLCQHKHVKSLSGTFRMFGDYTKMMVRCKDCGHEFEKRYEGGINAFGYDVTEFDPAAKASWGKGHVPVPVPMPNIVVEDEPDPLLRDPDAIDVDHESEEPL